MTASTVASESNDCTRAFTGVETTASCCAIGVGGTGTGDELSALGENWKREVECNKCRENDGAEGRHFEVWYWVES